MMKAEERIQWILDAKSNEELIAHYDEWSRSYEKDMLGTFARSGRRNLLHARKRARSRGADVGV